MLLCSMSAFYFGYVFLYFFNFSFLIDVTSVVQKNKIAEKKSEIVRKFKVSKKRLHDFILRY